MVILTRWACKTGLWVLLLLFACNHKPSVPTLLGALATTGDRAKKAKAFSQVALSGVQEERREAAMLWGLYACDAGTPVSALRAFAIAKPTGGAALVAARRLEEAARRAALYPHFINQVRNAGWLNPEARERVVLAAWEGMLLHGETIAARQALLPPESFSPATRAWARALHARVKPEEKLEQLKLLLEESPREALQLFPDEDWEQLSRALPPAAVTQLAEGLLAVGDAPTALRVARRTGAASVVAKAALALRRPQEAQRWAAQLPGSSAERYRLLAEAFRQQAWREEGQDRREWFARAAQAAREAAKKAEGGTLAEVQVLLAEALLEQGELSEVPHLLTASAPLKPPRWEWVARRAVMAFALRRTPLGLPAQNSSSRLTRLAQFWRGWVEWQNNNPGPLRELASSGHPDLPAQWAAQLTGTPVAWQPLEQPLIVPEPPQWARWWLRAGRVADVILGWRAELEASQVNGTAWLGLVELGDFPPLEAIPFLVRAEPRLPSGPWSQVPLKLLAEYLPLPFRSEIEVAARDHKVPPWIVAALVRQESVFNPRIRSAKGAVGLAQVLPATARLPAAALEDPRTNLRVGIGFLRRLRDRFGAWEPALAAYNAGERRVWPAWERAGGKPGPLFVENLEIPETWDYVHRVLLLAEGYRRLYWPQSVGESW